MSVQSVHGLFCIDNIFFQFNQTSTAHTIATIDENTVIILAAAPLSVSVTGGLLDDISA